jgi:hypothetical protein
MRLVDNKEQLGVTLKAGSDLLGVTVRQEDSCSLADAWHFTLLTTSSKLPNCACTKNYISNAVGSVDRAFHPPLGILISLYQNA